MNINQLISIVKKKLEKDPIYNLAQSLLTHFLNEVRPSFSQMTQDEEKLMKSFVKSLQTLLQVPASYENGMPRLLSVEPPSLHRNL